MDRNEGKSPGRKVKVVLKPHAAGECAALTAVQPVSQCSLVGFVSDKPLIVQLGYRYILMEKK